MYEESGLRTQRHVAKLEQKIKDLERTNARLSETLREGFPSRGPSTAIRAGREVEDDANVAQPVNDDTQECRNTIDGLATVSPLPLTERAAASYGGSSTIAFLRNLLVVVDARASVPGSDEPSGDPRLGPREEQTPRTLRDVDPSALVLPRRVLADSFVEAFCNIVHPLYPIIHKPTFISGYQMVWTSRPPPAYGREAREFSDTPLFWSAINLVFALGSQFSDLVEPSRRVSLAAEFYQRCRNLSDPELLDTASIEGVQVLLLMTVYLQSTHHASRCWNVLGLAIRAAQALGLHLEQRHLSCACQLDREMGRRVWYNCVILDQLQSMTFGRPTMLTKSKVTPPQAIDDDYLLPTGDDGVQPLQRQSQLAFFIHSISLFDILSDILSTIYPPDAASSQEKVPARSTTTATLQHIMKLSSDLDRFQANIPFHLRTHGKASFNNHPGAYDQQTATFNLQANVLYCRFLYTRLLLLRPILLSACAESQSKKSQRGLFVVSNKSSLEADMFSRVCALCVDTATALIDTICANMHSVLRNSVWYTVYFTFSAATVLLAARIGSASGGVSSPDSATSSSSVIIDDGESPSHQRGGDEQLVSEAAFHSAWDKVIAILDYHQHRIESAGRAARVLEALGAKVNAVASSIPAPASTDTAAAAAATATALQGGALDGANTRFGPSSVAHWMDEAVADRPYEWTAEDFNTLSLSNAWFMQQVSNLDFLELGNT